MRRTQSMPRSPHLEGDGSETSVLLVSSLVGRLTLLDRNALFVSAAN